METGNQNNYPKSYRLFRGKQLYCNKRDNEKKEKKSRFVVVVVFFLIRFVVLQ